MGFAFIQINRTACLVFIWWRCSVLCGIRQFLNINFINSSLILTGKNLHSVTDQKQSLQLVSLPVLRFFLVSIIPPLHYTYLRHSRYSYQKDKQKKRGNFQSYPLSDIKTHWPDEYFYSVLEVLNHMFCKRCQRWIIREHTHNSSDDDVSAPYFHAVAF